MPKINHKIKIFNTLTQEKDLIKPIKGKKINLFVCGPTVYDYSHLGHARNYVIFDAFVKYLRFCGFKVTYLQNITDVDDKIIARAREKGVSSKDLAVAFEKEYLADMKSIGITSVSKYARATAHVKEIINQVERLIKKGFAYELKDDGIYFDIGRFPDYGKLSGRTAIEAEDAVSRIDYSRNKKNRGDFCLWKISSNENEPSWDSPFGKGRPGWHVEDTAITEKFFGPQYDIHGAGRDLIFPHHEAEISQMEAVSGKSPMAKYWMHVGFLTINGQKMSKSLKNFITLKDFLRRYSEKYLRYFIIRNLWRSPVDYSESTMIEVKSSLSRIEEFLRRVNEIKKRAKTVKSTGALKLVQKAKADFYSELDDDFNTPKAFAVLFDLIKDINKFIDENNLSKKEAAEVFKLFQEIDKIFSMIDFKIIQKSIPASVKKLVQLREKYRKEQSWKKSDEVRLQIEKHGYVVDDTKDGPVIRVM